jgi:uncharacterized membrane protein
MVKIKHLPGSLQITLLPNRSLTWRQTLLVMCVFGGFCLSIAIIWAFVGAWLILPFAGIEVGLLVLVMYLVSKSTYDKQILLINEEFLSFQIGRGKRNEQTLFNRANVRLITYEVNHPEDVKELYLVETKSKKRIGEFLNLDDQYQLISQLMKAGIHPKEIKKPIQIKI